MPNQRMRIGAEVGDWSATAQVLPDGSVEFSPVDDVWQRVRGATTEITSPCIQAPSLNVRMPPCDLFDNIGAIQSKLNNSKRLTQAQIDIMSSVIVED